MNLSELSEAKLSRRDLLAKAGTVGLGAAALTMFAGRPAEAATATVADVLNFALNTEYLEAEFYTFATAGHGINGVPTPYGPVGTNGTGTQGTVVGSTLALSQVTFPNDQTRAIAQQITTDEQSHVALLRGILGDLAVAEPQINLSGMDAKLPTDPFLRFLALSRAFEDTGVSAYSGGSTLVRGSVSALQTAAQILGVEAYHASQARLLVAQFTVPTSKLDPLDVLPPPTGTAYFDVTNALAVTRTASQVLGILYGASTPTAFAPAGTASGGFFPNGVNGRLRTV